MNDLNFEALAREAGFDYDGRGLWFDEGGDGACSDAAMRRFMASVAAAVCEQCASICHDSDDCEEAARRILSLTNERRMTANEELDARNGGNVKRCLLTARILAREAHRFARDEAPVSGYGWCSFKPRMLAASLDAFSRIILEPVLRNLSHEEVLAPCWPASTAEYEEDGIFVRASIGSDNRDDIVLSVEIR